MSVYSQYSTIDELSISERTYYFRRSALDALRAGHSIAEMLHAKAETLANEQYEMAGAIDYAIEQWRRNPQLSLL